MLHAILRVKHRDVAHNVLTHRCINIAMPALGVGMQGSDQVRPCLSR